METNQIVHDLTMVLLNKSVAVLSPCELVSEYNKLFSAVEKEFKTQRKQPSVDIPQRSQFNGL